MDKLETGYILMPKEIIECESLNLGQKVLLSKVYGFTNSGAKCYLSNKTVGKLIGVIPNNAGKYINSLIKLGLIKRYQDDFSAFHTVDNLFTVLVGLGKNLPYKQKVVENDYTLINNTQVENDYTLSRKRLNNKSKTTKKVVENDYHKEIKEKKEINKDFINTNTTIRIIEPPVNRSYDKWLDDIINPSTTPPDSNPKYFELWIRNNYPTWKKVIDFYKDFELSKTRVLEYFNYRKAS